jgi:hypothetical protein
LCFDDCVHGSIPGHTASLFPCFDSVFEVCHTHSAIRAGHPNKMPFAARSIKFFLKWIVRIAFAE